MASLLNHEVQATRRVTSEYPRCHHHSAGESAYLKPPRVVTSRYRLKTSRRVPLRMASGKLSGDTFFMPRAR